MAQARLKLRRLLRTRAASVDRPDQERHRDATVARLAQPNDGVVGLSCLGGLQAIALADLGQPDAARRNTRATQANAAILRSSAEPGEIGRRPYALIRRYIEPYLP